MLIALTLSFVYMLDQLLFVLLLSLLVFEINGPWDEAKLCFDITD